MEVGIRKFASAVEYFLAEMGIRRALAFLIFPCLVEHGASCSFAKANLKGGSMQEEFRNALGAVWKKLHAGGELSLSQLKKQTKPGIPVSGRVIGWLPHKSKITFTQQKPPIRGQLI